METDDLINSDDEIDLHGGIEDVDALDKGDLIEKQGSRSKHWTHFKVWSKTPTIANCTLCKMDVK